MDAFQANLGFASWREKQPELVYSMGELNGRRSVKRDFKRVIEIKHRLNERDAHEKAFLAPVSRFFHPGFAGRVAGSVYFNCRGNSSAGGFTRRCP